MRRVYVARNIAKNAVARFVLPRIPSRGLRGMDGDTGRVVVTLGQLAAGIGATRRSLAGLDLLELGPGRTPHLSVAFALAGAQSVRTLDTADEIPTNWANPALYRGLVGELLGPAAATFREATGCEVATIQARYASGGPWPIDHAQYSGDVMPIGDETVDLIVSKSVLEHVVREDVERLVTEMRRVLRPGGAMVHMVDLRDHMWIDGDDVTGDWLMALQYSDRLFDLMFDNRSTYINRLRSSDWRRLFSDGLEVLCWEEQRYPLAPRWRRDRLDPRWRSLPEDELTIGQILIAVRRSFTPN